MPLRPGALAAAATALLAASSGPAVPQAPDSAEVVEELRDRQRDFERRRRLRLPPTGGSSTGDCDERVGRYCLFHGDGPGWKPPPEHPDVRRWRRELIGRLDRGARALPGDAWIAGQRVRYLVADGRPWAAAAAARACRAALWWCRALEAFAVHRAGEPRAAHDLFGSVLERMPDSTRRRWVDPSVILGDEAADRLEGLEGEARRSWLARLWWLADPLWSVPGSGRRSGHLARRVRCRLQRDAEGPYGSAWGDDLAELTMRYGWPVGFERIRPGHYGLGADPEVVAHHDASARLLVPPARVLEDPWSAGPDAWPLEPDEPESEYAPPALDTLVRPAVRTAGFPRPDSLHLVAAWRWEPAAGGSAALAAAAGPDGPRARATSRPGGATGALATVLPAGPAVASLELLDASGRRAARYRHGVRPPDRPEGLPGLSGLLLTRAIGDRSEPGAGVGRRGDRPGAADPPAGGRADTAGRALVRRGGAAPGTLEEAAARARPPGPARPGDRVGIYWEAYGRSDALEGGRTEVRLVKEEGGFLDAVARGLGLAEDARAVTVGWPTAPAPGARVHPAGIVLALPTGLEPGRYAVEIVVRPPGREPVTARTRIRVAGAGEG